MPTVFRAVAGDTLTRVQITLKDAGTKTVIDMTNKNATLRWTIQGGEAEERAMTVLDPSEDGVVRYQFAADDLVPGWMEADIQIEDEVTSKIVTSQRFFVHIVEGVS